MDGVFVPGPAVATLPGPQASYGSLSLLAWDSWGFLISRFDGAGSTLSLLAPDGSFAWSLLLPLLMGEPQVSASGEILVVSLLDRTTGDIQIARTDLTGRELEILDWEVSLPVRLSPDGRRVAYFSRDSDRQEVIVRGVDGAVVVSAILSDGRRGYADFEWTPDGRFVLVPVEPGQPPGLAFVDTEDGSSRIVPFADWVAFPTVLSP
jgi:hypothetical protein